MVLCLRRPLHDSKWYNPSNTISLCSPAARCLATNVTRRGQAPDLRGGDLDAM
ncbi:hypothetical protein DPMN_101069 [Dreissena polymorpha]|uniref:Uncharacterized protein n=1 Tax=Dreissena polymorpha TaxID=45954 RepID=A0A9D4LKE6_DREPO|nr:hypothetical protein DPMN_101069 [Dreissena polymorpha]